VDTKKYIESGILEIYVFGKLSEAEEQEVQNNAGKYSDIKLELSRVEIAFEQYALAKGIPPPPGTLAGILRKTNPNSGVSQTSTTQNNFINYILAGLTAVSILATYYFYAQVDVKSNSLVTKTEQLQTLNEDCEQIKKINKALETQVQVFKDPNYQDVSMNATGKYEDTNSNAIIYYNKTEKKAWLDVRSLDNPPTGKQYQLWAIVNGTPVDMGVFDNKIEVNTALQSVPYVADTQAFAVTIEDTGGVKSPTLEEMIVVGNVG
jgi:hypothetical protein